MKTILSIVLLLAAAMGLNAQAVQRSLLANQMDANTGTVYIYSSQIPQALAQGYIYVDSEVMLVQTTFLSPSVVTSNSIVILTVARGYLGTTAAAHGAGSLVLYGYPTQFLGADPTGPCVPYGTQYLSYLHQQFFSCGPNAAWFGVTTSNALGAFQLSNGVTGSGEIVLQNTPTIVSPNLTGTPLVNGNKIGAFRVLLLPSSCVAGTDPGVLFDSGGLDALYVCDNTGHYVLPPGGSTTILSGAVTGPGGANIIAAGANGLVLSSASGTTTSAVAAPSGAVVGTTDTQILTNKNLAGAGNTFPTLNQNTTGTASALTTAPSTCGVNSALVGISANGNPTTCAQISCPNILNYGGSNNGSTPNDTALTNLIAANISDQQCVYLPSGHFSFTNAATWTAPNSTASIIFKGEGPGVTQLVFPNSTNGLVLNVLGSGNTVHVRDMALRTGKAGVGAGISIVNSGAQAGFAASDITDVQFYGSDGYAATNYWNVGVLADAFSNLNLTNVGFVGSPSGAGGSGVAIELKSTTGVVGAVFNLTQINCSYSNVCLQIVDHIQGVTMSQSNATAVNYGVLVQTGIPYGDNDELSIGPGNQFSAAIYDVLIQSPFRHTQVFNNYFLTGGSSNGLLFDNYAMTSVTNNQFIHLSSGTSTAITFDHYNNDDAKVFGNDSQFFNIGLDLTTNSQHVTCLMNNGVSNTTDVSNNGTGNACSISFMGAPTVNFHVVDGVIVAQ